MSSINVGAPTRGINDIGRQGREDFGVGLCPAVPAGYTQHPDHYGNYRFTDGSEMIWRPANYVRIGHAGNDTFATDGLQSIEIVPFSRFSTVAAANASGFFLPRMFYNAGSIQPGAFQDKWGCSNNGGVASSIPGGAPLSTSSAHNPISALNGSPQNIYGGVFAACKTRGARFRPLMKYERFMSALVSMAQGQAARSAADCAWLDRTGARRMGPRGNNNNAFGDANDSWPKYLGDGYQNCGRTGSGRPMALTTDNGNPSGMGDTNGNVWEVSPGVTCVATSGAITAITQAAVGRVTQPAHGRTGSGWMRIDGGQMTQANNKLFFVTYDTADTYLLNVDTTTWTTYTSGASGTHGVFYGLSLAADAAALTGGNTLATDAWGATGLAAHSEIVPVQFGHGMGFDLRWGNGANRVLNAATSGADWMELNLGFPDSSASLGTAGTNAFGTAYFYAYVQNELCPIVGGHWNGGAFAGAWAVYWNGARSSSFDPVGFRAASYL